MNVNVSCLNNDALLTKKLRSKRKDDSLNQKPSMKEELCIVD